MSSARHAPADTALEQGFQLRELRIEPHAGEVSGPGGREKLDPKVMDVLVLLAQHVGQVVLREDLLAKLWPDVVVTEDALSRCIYELRRQLSLAGSDEQLRALIETLPKRGYRLNGSVTPLASRPAQSGGRPNRRWLTFGVGGMAALVFLVIAAYRLIETPPGTQSKPAAGGAKAIAVLPFVDMSAGRDQQFLSDGIAEEILDRLAKAGQLRVIARTSSFSFRDRPADIPEIAAKLNVSHVLEGSVRRSGDRIRITVQLVEGAGASHVWSETYDRTLGELFTVQDEIATTVAAALQATLEGSSPHGKLPAKPEAYESFLQGELFYNRRAPGDIERAVKYYEEAVSRDSDYARAWVALSGAYGLMWWQLGHDPKVWRPRQGEAALRAVELDPTLVAAHIRAADYYSDLSNRRKSVEHLRKAAALDSDDPWLAGYGYGLVTWDDRTLEEQADIAGRSVEHDPLSAVKRHNFGLLLFALGRLDEAKSEFLKAVELNPGISWDTTLEMRRVLIAQRRYDEAHAAIMQLKESEARDYGLALLYHAPRYRAEADAALGRLNARAGEYMHGIRVAEAYAYRGKIDAAFATLQRARDGLERDESILTRIWWFQHEMLTSPFLKPLHSDPRWESLVAMPAGDTAEEIIEGLWPGARFAESR